MIGHYLSSNNETYYSNFSPYFSHTKRGLAIPAFSPPKSPAPILSCQLSPSRIGGMNTTHAWQIKQGRLLDRWPWVLEWVHALDFCPCWWMEMVASLQVSGAHTASWHAKRTFLYVLKKKRTFLYFQGCAIDWVQAEPIYIYRMGIFFFVFSSAGAHSIVQPHVSTRALDAVWFVLVDFMPGIATNLFQANAMKACFLFFLFDSNNCFHYKIR